MKWLILHASAGGGHRRAAEALAAAAGQAGHATVVRDILDFTPPLYRRTYAKGYLALIRSAPELWGYLYAKSDRSAQLPLDRRVRAAFNQLNALSFTRFFRRTAPDAILCTHFLPLELTATLPARIRQGRPLFGIVTDFAAHSLWFCRGVDACFVATEEARRQLIRKGQPKESIQVTGIPVMPGFAPDRDSAEARQRLGLRPDLPAVLVLNGGLGVGPALGLMRAAREHPAPCQWMVVIGRNPRLESRVRDEAARVSAPVTVQGFVDNLHDWMAAADLVVSKPGGLTMAEALAMGKPAMLMDPIPGQEQRNAEYLLEAGAAVRAFDPEEALWKIDTFFRDPSRLDTLAANARRLGRPQAARDILRYASTANVRPDPVVAVR
jgi:processive 1,2-diacylglycerol beta-glucosyltransferase